MTRRTLRGCAKQRVKLTEADVCRIREIWQTTTQSLASIGRQYGVTKMTVSHIVSRVTWKHV